MSVTINVNLDHTNYPIYIGNALIENTAEILSPTLSKRKVFIISDTNVSNLYLHKLENSLKNYNILHKSIVVDAGESTKSFKRHPKGGLRGFKRFQEAQDGSKSTPRGPQ